METNSQHQKKSWMAAVAFAEAGEWDTAREMMPVGPRRAEVTSLDRLFAAASFAEAGEWGAAREMIPAAAAKTKVTWLDRLFAAVTFAEAGLDEEARRLVGSGRSAGIGRFEELGLRGARFTFGVVAVNEW